MSNYLRVDANRIGFEPDISIFELLNISPKTIQIMDFVVVDEINDMNNSYILKNRFTHDTGVVSHELVDSIIKNYIYKVI